MNPTLRKRALLLGIILLFILIASVIFLTVRYKDHAEQYTAYIYQDGKLYKTIDLSAVTADYTLVITATDGGMNQVLVQPGSICVTEANCPDLVCVHQGTIRNDLLPITCLPHKLVISLKPTDGIADVPDAITH
jgi:hypothetical protein